MTPKFAGIAVGGSAAGTMLENFRPVHELKPKVAVFGVKQQKETYYYVPIMGMQGFWLHESETQGTGPWDDIFRVLTEFYVHAHTERDTSDSRGTN